MEALSNQSTWASTRHKPSVMRSSVLSEKSEQVIQKLFNSDSSSSSSSSASHTGNEMTIALDSSVELYPHDPIDIIPLLESRGSRSLPVLSTIRENLSIPSTSSAKRSGSYGVVYTTFPSLPTHTEGVWAVVVQMQDPEHTHLRMFCSANRDDPDGDGRGVDLDSFMDGLGGAIVRIWGKEVILGAVDSYWHSRLKGKLEADDVVECTVFLAPLSSSNEEDEELEALGLTFDHARPGDVDLIRRTCDVPRPVEYYLSRASHTSVLRESEKAVCWIMHHTDGSLGALYTVPQWRRRGLAKYVVQRRIRDRHNVIASDGQEVMEDQKGKERDFCYVFKGNAASEALWKKLGWEEGWGVKWVVNRHVGRARGEVVIHRDEGVKAAS